MAQLFGYHNSVGGSAARREGEINEQADKNEEQTWQSIELKKGALLPHKRKTGRISLSSLNFEDIRLSFHT